MFLANDGNYCHWFAPIIPRVVRLTVTRNGRNRAWRVCVKFGRGAGYKWGATAYIARNCVGGKPGDYLALYRRAPLRAGFSRNANKIPYLQ